MESITEKRKTITMSDGPSQGKKPCPSCKRYLGVRTQTCECGHIFEKREKTVSTVASVTTTATNAAPPVKRRKKDPLPDATKVIHIRSGYLYTPGGLSLSEGLKIKLQGSDYNAVGDWANRLVNMGMSEGFNYGPTALRYFVRYYADINSPEYRVLCNHLAQWSQEYFSAFTQDNENKEAAVCSCSH